METFWVKTFLRNSRRVGVCLLIYRTLGKIVLNCSSAILDETGVFAIVVCCMYKQEVEAVYS